MTKFIATNFYITFLCSFRDIFLGNGKRTYESGTALMSHWLRESHRISKHNFTLHDFLISHISLFGTNPFHIDKNAHTKKQHQLCHVNSSNWQQTTKNFLFLSIFHNALRHNRHKKSLIFLTWFDKIDDADDAYQNDSILSINHNYCTRHISNVFHKLAVAYMYHTLFHHA